MRLLISFLVTFSLFIGWGGNAFAQGTGSNPNIIFFLADDMGLGDTSAYQDLTGNSDGYQVYTPNLERLAQMGTRFTDAHAGAAVCTPTRLSLLTGTHSFRSPIKQRTSFVNQDNIGSLLQGTRQTFAGMLRNQGYSTYGVGKWHAGLQADYTNHVVHEGPTQLGFDHYTGTPGNFPGEVGIMRDNKLYSYDSNFNLVDFNDPNAINWDPWTAKHQTGNIAITRAIQQTNLDASQQYLADHIANQGDKPFMLYYASHANHTPYVGPDTLDGETVSGNTVAGGYVNIPVDANNNPTGPEYGNIDLANHWNPYLKTDANGNIIANGPGERFQLINENDIIMGKMLDYLENTDDPRNPGHKLIDNTLVIFTSDNGSDIKSEPSVGALPQKNNGTITDIRGKKATQFEGGTRVPFIAAWANKIGVGQTSDALFGLNDIYATLAEITGAQLEAHEAVDSESILDALEGNATGDFRNSMLVYKNRQRLIIRDGDFKLILADPDYNGDGSDRFNGNLDFANMTATRLFDLSTDLSESNNLVNDPAQQQRIATMLAALQGYVNNGFSRAGAAQILNGRNFQGGGSILDAANYQGYGDGTAFELPVLTTNNPSFVFMDGDLPDRVDGAWIIQGNGTATFTGSKAGLQNGSTYELRRGGTLVSTTKSFQINGGSTLQMTGGTADFSGQVLRLNKGDGLVELRDGEITAKSLRIEDLNSSTDGAKVIRFMEGPGGTLTLTDANNPIKFGAANDPGNDFIDFMTGSLGQLITMESESYFVNLWDNGQLRIDGLTSNELASNVFGDYFAYSDVGGGFSSLSLKASAVPEPAALPLLALSVLLVLRRRSRNK